MLHIMTLLFFFTCFHFSSYHFYLGPHNFTHGLFQQTPSCSLSIQFHANPFFIVLTKLIFLKHCFITSLFSSRMMWFPVSYWIKHKALHFSPFQSCSHQLNVSLWTFNTAMQSYGSPHDVFTSVCAFHSFILFFYKTLLIFQLCLTFYSKSNYTFISSSNSFLSPGTF